MQSISIFPACTSLFQDFYFKLAYHLSLRDDWWDPSSTYLFPEYASKAYAAKERVQSKVPVFFWNMVDEITKSCSDSFESVVSLDFPFPVRTPLSPKSSIILSTVPLTATFQK